MEWRDHVFRFPVTKGQGPVSQTRTFTFVRRVAAATAGITGYEAEFQRRGGDHHLGRLEVRLETEVIDPHTVTVTGHFGLRDWSGDWDDNYGGKVSFVVLAELGRN